MACRENYDRLRTNGGLANHHAKLAPTIRSGSWRVETVGRPLPGVEVKIVDPASGGGAFPDNAARRTTFAAAGAIQSCLGLLQSNLERPRMKPSMPRGWLQYPAIVGRAPCPMVYYTKITGRIKGYGDSRRRKHLSARKSRSFYSSILAVEQASWLACPNPKYGEELCALGSNLGRVAKRARTELRHFFAAANWRDTKCRAM